MSAASCQQSVAQCAAPGGSDVGDNVKAIITTFASPVVNPSSFKLVLEDDDNIDHKRLISQSACDSQDNDRKCVPGHFQPSLTYLLWWIYRESTQCLELNFHADICILFCTEPSSTVSNEDGFEPLLDDEAHWETKKGIVAFGYCIVLLSYCACIFLYWRIMVDISFLYYFAHVIEQLHVFHTILRQPDSPSCVEVAVVHHFGFASHTYALLISRWMVYYNRDVVGDSRGGADSMLNSCIEARSYNTCAATNLELGEIAGILGKCNKCVFRMFQSWYRQNVYLVVHNSVERISRMHVPVNGLVSPLLNSKMLDTVVGSVSKLALNLRCVARNH